MAKKRKTVDDLEASERIAVAATAIREGRKRGAESTLEEIIEEEDPMSSSAIEEEEPASNK